MPQSINSSRSNAFNKLAVLKEIGAIEYRVADTETPASIRRDCIARNVQNLIAELTTTAQNSARFGGILERLADRHIQDSEILAGCALLRSLIPLTYGCLPAGTVFGIEPTYGVFIKRKDGAQGISTGVLYSHFAADRPVFVTT